MTSLGLARYLPAHVVLTALELQYRILELTGRRDERGSVGVRLEDPYPAGGGVGARSGGRAGRGRGGRGSVSVWICALYAGEGTSSYKARGGEGVLMMGRRMNG